MNTENNCSLEVPTVWEMLQAGRVFTEYVQNHAQEVQCSPENQWYTSMKAVKQLALVAVWMAGRRYEHNLSMKKMEE